MEKIKDGFTIPSYLLEEIVDYIDSGRPESKKRNLYTLIKTAELNNRFTSSEAEYILDIIK